MLACSVLHGHFGPVYLLQVIKNNDEERLLLKVICLQIQTLGYFFARDLIISGTYDHGMKKNNPMR